MKILKIICSAALLLLAGAVSGQSIWNVHHLEEVKAHLSSPVYHEAYQALLKRAEKNMTGQLYSVMQKEVVPPSGSKHDYTSLSRYTWPNPKTKNGLPYVTRDGESNPELEKYDRNALGDMGARIKCLSLASYFSGDRRYAERASQQLRTWFLDKATCMNPNMKYAQCIPGESEGRCYGVLDALSFVEMLEGVQLLEYQKMLPETEVKDLQLWFRRFLKWLTTDPQALEEGRGGNNHAVAYDLQVAAYARFVGDEALFKKVLTAFPSRRIAAQIRPDGRQPRELRRTLAFGYSSYNIRHMLMMMMMAQNVGLDWHRYGSSGESSIMKAVDFMKPYLLHPASWPYKQIGLWDEKRQEMAENCYMAWLLEPSRPDLQEAFYETKDQTWNDDFTLLYFRPTATDNIMAGAGEQLRYALSCVDSAKFVARNKDVFTPATFNKDGSLMLVGPIDWRSGFFAGSLWQMYGYTHDVAWRKLAETFTSPLKPLENYRGSHDLGFMVGDSYGKWWELTGDTAARNVVIQASRSLISRFNPRVGCIRSWDHNRDKWKYPVIIDNMMNLEMLFKATQFTGDSTFWKIAVTHANTTMRNHFRPDFSSYHVVNYDPETGQVLSRNTAQGYSDDSFWSRGQAWGLYGYTMCYRYTHDSRYLDQARHIFAFLQSLDNVPADGIYFWDQRDPHIPDAPRDASAAAVVASALYELANYVQADEALTCRQYADHIMKSLTNHYRAKVGTAHGFLLLHSTGNLPAGNEIDVPLNYADYYYIEALLRSNKK